MYLLDTMVISELPKRNRNPGVFAWLEDRKNSDTYISVISMGEIKRGIYLQKKKNPQFAKKLSLWLKSFNQTWGDKILPVTLEIAMEWGKLSAYTGNSGVDNLIAATAKIHNLTLVTRNEKHFEKTGVTIINPWT